MIRQKERLLKTIWSGKKIYCNGEAHYTIDTNGKELHRWPCGCGKPIPHTSVKNEGAAGDYGKGSGSWTGD
jgi:hypothetical protein